MSDGRRPLAIGLVRIARGILAVLLAGSLSAPATTIPPDLEARAAELRRQASPQLLTWVNDQGAALAKAHGPVDTAALAQSVRSQFTRKRVPSAKTGSAVSTTNWSVLGNQNGADVEALCFLVLMAASKSAQEDLKEIMAHVKAINHAKAQQRASMQASERKTATALAPTPTPAPDRLAELVAAAKSVHGKTAGANLTMVTRR